jgi:hypothetical protein
VDFTATNNSTATLSQLFLKADGVYDVRSDTAGWIASVFSPTDHIDIDGDGIYDRGVKLLPEADGLAPGASLQFRINSAYGHNIMPGHALATLDTDTVLDCESAVSDDSIVGDIDGNGYVDVNDLAVMASHWLVPDANSPGNLNNDGIVNLDDFAKLAGNWNFEPFIIDTNLEPEDMIFQNEVNCAYNPDAIELWFMTTNNNTGAIYDSGSINLFAPLANQLYALPCNQSTYGSLSEMLNTWRVSISGEVSNGWSGTVNGNGSIELSHNGLWYDQWLSTSENPAQNLMNLAVLIPTDQLETDGVTGYDINTDARIELGIHTMSEVFIGWEGGAGYPKTGFEYDVIKN